MEALKGRTVVLCVTGSIAAYKAVEVARLCLQAGARVLPVMSASASRFVGAVTFSGLTGEAVATDMWDPSYAGEMHVALAARADVVAVVPATADVLARFATGRADDLVTAIALATRAPLLAAPAMHPRMWEHPATQRNVLELARQGRVSLIGPVTGPVASGEIGMGRMAEPAAIVLALERALSPRDLGGLRIVVTAGPTREDIDPVRFVGNRSSGKMGFAVASRAAARGAEVMLIAGPVALPTPPGVRRVDVLSALAMRDALWAAAGDDLSGMDALVMTAAVADYRPATVADRKVKKTSETMRIDSVRNPDLLAEIGDARAERDANSTSSPGARSATSANASVAGHRRPVLIGFAVETGTIAELVAYARDKLVRKRIDLVVANAADVAFEGDDNRATLVTEAAVTPLDSMSKTALADVILDCLLRSRS